MEDQCSPAGLAFGDKISGEANITNNISVLWNSGDRHYKNPQTVCTNLHSPSMAKCQLSPFSWWTEAMLGWFFLPQNSKWWTEVHHSEVIKWQERFPPAEVTPSSHRRMKMATTKWTNQPIKFIVGLVACSAKNLQTPILPVYNVQIKPPLTASSCGRLNICSRRAAAACGGKKAPRWCVHRWGEPVLTALPLIQHQMTHGSFWGEGDSCVGTLQCLHAVWALFRPHFDEFGCILTLVWPSVLGALWSTCSGELWWGIWGGWGLVGGNHVNLSSG